MIFDLESSSPPCKNALTMKKYKIESICDLIKVVSHMKQPFLKLMKFSKQSPVYLEDQDEYTTLSAKYGHTLKNNSKVS